eukprot:sb/3464383/
MKVQAEYEKFTIEARITIKEIYLGKPTVARARPNMVIFHRMVDTFFLSNTFATTSHETNNSTWIAKSKKTDEGLTFLVMKCNSKSQTPSGAVIITIRGPNSVETRTGNVGENISFRAEISKKSVVTFLIHEQPFLCEPEFPKGVDFGREFLSLPTHGNISFILQDGSKVPLNSYILSRNSPVLKTIIEEDGELDHDVSDFEPESVRIFADACYTGTLEMLSNATEFKVFSDFVKMVSVFKVEWAKCGCLEFYKRNIPKQGADFDAYWNYAILALDSTVKYSDRRLLEYLLSRVPKNKTKYMFRISRLLVETTKRSHLDLVMVMVVEFNLVNEFMQQTLAMMMIQHSIPLLKYWLDNFNFTLCTVGTLSLLAEVVELNTDAESSLKLMAAIQDESDEKESSKQENEESDLEEGGAGVSERADMEDGTLATVARNHWRKIESSKWPCSKTRPFCPTRRKLWENEEEEERETED